MSLYVIGDRIILSREVKCEKRNKQTNKNSGSTCCGRGHAWVFISIVSEK